jgi:hypothetical protein
MNLINTHLAFGDAQTDAMLDPAGIADKDYQGLHWTEMSYAKGRTPPIPGNRPQAGNSHF